MARNKALFTDLLSSGLGLAFCAVATVTPGFLINENQKMSIFYFIYKEIGSNSWSTKTYLAYDKEHDTKGLNQRSMLYVQLECLLTLVLGGFGWLVLLSNTRKTAPIPLRCLTGGIFLLLAASSEFAVLIRFIVLNTSHSAVKTNLQKLFDSLRLSKVKVPISLIVAGFGITLIFIAVVRIFIRYKRNQLTSEIHHRCQRTL
ncbi:uncharacterized protein LOC134272250 isoform X2 [Saccostrea cucullata]|uniref:uncharacterized protein LOC134272250 isoform X2 n=1 Tax=Saccostrea cuccullata TaxID=36930 RepID=UPI002ECFE0B2